MAEKRYSKVEGGFGQKLQGHRTLKKMTQEELARISGVPLSTIQALEINRRRPLQITATKLAKALGVLVPELYK